MRTQIEDYAIHARPVPGWAGGTDKARFIFHMGRTAYLFGKHEGRTLVVEFFTTGFLLRFRLMQTKESCNA